jgi:filamentous hemagglutinin
LACGLANQIAGGHSFEKHVLQQGEYIGLGIRTRAQFAGLVDDVINNPTYTRSLSNGRTAYWSDTFGTVVIHNPRAVDGGTAFRPSRGINYFNGLR